MLNLICFSKLVYDVLNFFIKQPPPADTDNENENPVLPEAIQNRSHKHLTNSVYLLKNTKKSVEFIENNLNKKKLLMFYSKFYEVMNWYSNVFLGYKYPGTINLYSVNVEAEIKTGTLYIQELI